MSLKIGYFEPPASRDYPAWNLTWMYMKTHYDLHGQHRDRVQWMPPPFDWCDMPTIEDAIGRYIDCDVILFSSYIWNYSVNDYAACWIKQHYPHIKTVMGGPQQEVLRDDFNHRYSMYDYMCGPTDSGEIYMQDWIDSYFANAGTPRHEEIAFDHRSNNLRKSFYYSYVSVYEHHRDYISQQVKFFTEKNITLTIPWESTRGCPFACTFCEWGGGTGSKLKQKTMDHIRLDLDVIQSLGISKIDILDSNTGILDRDFEMLQMMKDRGITVRVINLAKTKKYDRKLKIIDRMMDMDLRIVLSIQTFSQEALANAKRPDLTEEEHFRMVQHIRQRLIDRYGPDYFDRPINELREIATVEMIMGMPGSTLDDFYREFDLINLLHCWEDHHWEYSYLPASESSDPEDLKRLGVELTPIYHMGMFGTKDYYYTIASSYSFSREDMQQMFFMNQAAGILRTRYYEELDTIMKPSEFLKFMYSVISNLPQFEPIRQQIKDFYDPDTEPCDLYNLRDNQGNLRPKKQVVQEFLDEVHPLLYTAVMCEA